MFLVFYFHKRGEIGAEFSRVKRLMFNVNMWLLILILPPLSI
jgi:hypothetical protein